LKYAIIGAGNTGHAVSAYLCNLGEDCTLFTRNQVKADEINREGITSKGSVTGIFHLKATSDLADAIQGADIIIVMTTANAHRDVATKLKQVVTDNQKIIIFNGNWGAFQFFKILGDDIKRKGLTVAETSAQLFLANSPEPGKVTLTLKEKVMLSATSPVQTEEIIQQTRHVFPQFEKASSIFETTMSSTNPVIHVPITLLNLARVENEQAFKFYGEGASRTAVKLILDIDQERVKVAKALGCDTKDVLTGINSFWEIKHDNLFDALTKNETYLKSMGPKALNHRYITEDVPFGVAPIAQVGNLFGVSTPHTQNLIDMLKNLVNDELLNDGIEFRMEDFEKLLLS